MDTFKITSFDDLHKRLRPHHNEWHRWYYRGHSNVLYTLVPKTGRAPYRDLDDRKMFEAWKTHAVAYIESGPKALTDWDYLAIAQHHGLATRFLDWTFNALAATFFALVDSPGYIDTTTDGVVFAHYSTRETLREGSKRAESPFEHTSGVHRVRPSSVAPRIIRQGGIFTLHGPPTTNLEDALRKGDSLVRFVFEGKYKREIAITLSHYGVNKMSMFPDLDGLSSHMNWSFLNLPYTNTVTVRRTAAPKVLRSRKHTQKRV